MVTYLVTSIVSYSIFGPADASSLGFLYVGLL